MGNKNTFDWPGRYVVVANTFVKSAKDMKEAKPVADAWVGGSVDVVEVGICDNRIRGRITKPAGWISLRSVDDEKVFAVPFNSAYAKRFRQTNPKFFDLETCYDSDGFEEDFYNTAYQTCPHRCFHELHSKLHPEDSVDQCDERGFTALAVMIKKRWPEGVQAMLQIRADVDLADQLQRRPLHLAVKASRSIAELVLQAKADPNTQDAIPLELKKGIPSQRTPLHYSVEAGDEDITESLLQGRANPDIRDGEQKGPLHVAMEGDHDSIIDLLVASGADVNLGGDRIGSMQIMHHAVHKGDVDLARKLILARAHLDVKEKSGMTPLHLAARARNVRMVRLLVEAGCDRSIKEASGLTAGELAEKRGLTQIVELIGSTEVPA